MTWSYNPAVLMTSSKDALRFLIGDTVQTDQQLQDEELSYTLGSRSTVYGAAAECCRSLSTKFSRSVDQQAGTQKILYSQMAKAYAAKALQFEQKAATSGGAIPYAGGISIRDKQFRELDLDRVPPQFAIGLTDNLVYPVGPDANETESSGGAN